MISYNQQQGVTYIYRGRERGSKYIEPLKLKLAFYVLYINKI